MHRDRCEDVLMMKTVHESNSGALGKKVLCEFYVLLTVHPGIIL